MAGLRYKEGNQDHPIGTWTLTIFIALMYEPSLNSPADLNSLKHDGKSPLTSKLLKAL